MATVRVEGRFSRGRLRTWACWAAVGLLTAGLSAYTVAGTLERYHQFRTGWSWDLAYYNQWYWALTQGDGILSVRPISAYSTEGPSVWRMNYLAPVRFLLVPLYMRFPDPRTLLVIQSLVFWWVVPAAFTLVRSETGSTAFALSAATLVPLTPLLWPLAWNDFRELQLALPFVLWAIQGVRGRNVGLAAFGIAGMLFCRQEFAPIVSTFALIPPRQPEDVGRSYRWTRALILVGLAWFLFGFFGYLSHAVGKYAPEHFLQQFGGPKPPIDQTIATATELVAYGVAPWCVLALLSPRVAILALPWLWGLAGGKWSLRQLATVEWHHVRYAAPIVGLLLAAGLLGYAFLGRVSLPTRRGRVLVAVVWCLAVLGGLTGLRAVDERFQQAPRLVQEDEVEDVWRWIGEVQPEDSVLADYRVTAPLSSRRWLYSYELEQNKPKGYPQLGPEFRWVFLATGRVPPGVFQQQGFVVVHEGLSVTILRRGKVGEKQSPPNGRPGSPSVDRGSNP